jgi:hypothetical protein
MFEPALGTAQLPFALSEIDFQRPTEETWRKNWKVYHEWAHFYQFVTTSYGALFRAATMAQMLTVANLVSAYDGTRSRCQLPLLANESRPLQEHGHHVTSDSPWQVELRIAGLLEDYRELIYGYKVTKPGFEEGRDPERSLFLMLIHEQYGLPPISFVWSHESLPEEAAIVADFEINDLLESHAHALSSLWLIQTVERLGLARSIRDAALDATDRLAIGPYGRFFDVAANAGHVKKGYLMHTICTLCDLALNPPGFNDWGDTSTVTMLDAVWSPVTRLLHLFVLGAEDRLPELDMTVAGWQGRYLGDLHGSLESGWDAYFPPYDTYPYNSGRTVTAAVVEKLKRAVEQGVVPSVAGLYLIDGFETYANAQRARSSPSEPLLLAGNSIEDLAQLLQVAGAPTVIVPDGDAVDVYARWCLGLRAAGYPRAADREWNSQVVEFGAAWLIGLRRLLYESRIQLAAGIDEPLFGRGGGPTLRDLLSWYGRRLEDFD